MIVNFTELWTVPPIPVPMGIFPTFDWVCVGENEPYASWTWDIAPYRYTEVHIPQGSKWYIRVRSNIQNKSPDENTYVYVLSNFSPKGVLRIDFTYLVNGVPLYQLQLQLRLHDYAYARFKSSIFTTDCGWETTTLTEDNYYTKTMFGLVGPNGRHCCFIRPVASFGAVPPWKYLMFPPFNRLFPGLQLPKVS